jgi:hypothetical protein
MRLPLLLLLPLMPSSEEQGEVGKLATVDTVVMSLCAYTEAYNNEAHMTKVSV